MNGPVAIAKGRAKRQKILELFYRTTLRPGEKVINNADADIAFETGINKAVVTHILYIEVKRRKALHWIKINEENVV